MSAYNLTSACVSTIFEDVVNYFDKLIEKPEKLRYDRDDPYCRTIVSFDGIKLLMDLQKIKMKQ